MSVRAAPRSVVLLGGTFDPPTRAHVAVAVAARRQLGAEEAWLVPTGEPWQKNLGTPGPVRAEMCRLAVAGISGLAVATVEVERDGPTYTHETLKVLVARHPGCGFTFLVGDDVDLSTWANATRCISLARFRRIPRSGYPRRGDIPRIDIKTTPVSSTEVRRRVAAGRSFEKLVPAAVAAYIKAEGLYLPSAKRSRIAG